MDNYPSFSYPESGDSSPRSREIDFENPPPTWDEQSPPQPTQKIKFMVSYGGKIQPRPHDNLLAYVGGETKILAVERGVKFSHIRSKLASLISLDLVDGFTFKYQLPGEDLDALISVTNDDDLEHMMHEFDRLCKASPKPARLRLFLFIDQLFHLQARRNSAGSGFSSISSDRTGLDREPGLTSLVSTNQNAVVLDPPLPVQNNVDFLFGLDKVSAAGPVQVDRVQISAQELQLQNMQQSAVFPAMNEENLGETYRKTPSPVNIPANIQIPQGFWPPIEQQQQNHQSLQQMQQHQQFHHQQQQQPVYMMHAPPAQGNIYHAPVMPPPNQGYYQVQQMPVYSTPAAQVMPGMMTAESAGYAPVNQVYYTAAPVNQGGGVTAAYGGMTAVVSDEMKVVQKVGTSPGGV
ncbi:hypothetical protein RND81_14G196700 [Saponaria officinalis]|uniref:PB1 domain-containing protein n=1 Tax=Saponaria officinalis TaxID=3572 RepID=A0AAW1GSP2_SAPOF